jgi:N-acetylglucosamine kinase-like BadF-type ATPase
MVIIADSGGSKIDWRLLTSKGEIKQAHTSGFNPYYQPIEDLNESIESFVPQVDEPVSKIFFYGAGVSSEKNQNLIKDAFKHFFPNAHTEVGWDLLAAARALCGDEPGIACIMGTGSNSCLYDGEKITYVVANLGWILADEGSGTKIGKKFLFDYLRLKQPPQIAEAFKRRFPFTREEFLEKVYQEEKPGAFLASFTKFIFQHLKDPYCYQLIYDSFAEFYEEVVMRYENYQQYKVHFTGSVAFYFSDIVRQVATDKGITVKNIMEGPIAGLTLYHKKDL